MNNAVSTAHLAFIISHAADNAAELEWETNEVLRRTEESNEPNAEKNRHQKQQRHAHARVNSLIAGRFVGAHRFFAMENYVF